MLPGISLLLGLGGLLVATATSGGNASCRKYATGGIVGFSPELYELCEDVFKRNLYHSKDTFKYAPTMVPPGWYEAWVKEQHIWYPDKVFPDQPTDDMPILWDQYGIATKIGRDWNAKLEYIRWLAKEKHMIFNEEQVSRYVRLGW